MQKKTQQIGQGTEINVAYYKKQLLIYSFASYLRSDQTCSLPPRKWNGLFSSVSTFLIKKKLCQNKYLKETIAFIVNITTAGHKEKLRQLPVLSLLCFR